MTPDTLLFAARHAEKGQPVVLVTLTEARGTSPARPGLIMAVLQDGQTEGTIGGGVSEYEVIRRAQQAMRDNEAVFTFNTAHCESGSACGGMVSGYGVLLQAGPQLLIFGGGHVSQPLSKMGEVAGFAVTVVEDRPEFEGAFPHARFVLATPAEFEVKIAIGQNTSVVICTRGHNTDLEALRYCIGKGAPYIGMIGSGPKVDSLFGVLRKEGVAEGALARVHAPIGLDIANHTPGEIAVAVLAEVLCVKNEGQLRHKKLA
jgi:xanthine dehydrogenase accessory factor